MNQRRPAPRFKQKLKKTGMGYLDYVKADKTMDEDDKKYSEDCFKRRSPFNVCCEPSDLKGKSRGWHTFKINSKK